MDKECDRADDDDDDNDDWMVDKRVGGMFVCVCVLVSLLCVLIIMASDLQSECQLRGLECVKNRIGMNQDCTPILIHLRTITTTVMYEN